MLILILALAFSQDLYSDVFCSGGITVRVESSARLDECEFKCKRYGLDFVASEFMYSVYHPHGRGDCMCSTHCECLREMEGLEVHVDASVASSIPDCATDAEERYSPEQCMWTTDETWSDSNWIRYKCGVSKDFVSRVLFSDADECKSSTNELESVDYELGECFEAHPGEFIQFTACDASSVHFRFCGLTTLTPTEIPSTSQPTSKPTPCPTFGPTDSPTVGPTDLPTMEPNFLPSRVPSLLPSRAPSASKAAQPSFAVSSSTLYPSPAPAVNYSTVSENGGVRQNGAELEEHTQEFGFLVVVLTMICCCVFVVWYCLCSICTSYDPEKDDHFHIMLDQDSCYLDLTGGDAYMDPSAARAGKSRESYAAQYGDASTSFAIRAPIDLPHSPANPRFLSLSPTNNPDMYSELTLASTPRTVKSRDAYVISTLPRTPHHKRDPSFFSGDFSQFTQSSSQSFHNPFVQSQSPRNQSFDYGFSESRTRYESTEDHTQRKTPSKQQRFSLRAISPSEYCYNELKDQVVMSSELRSYLMERKLAKFIPDLEAKKVRYATDFLKLHSDDLDDFSVVPNIPERNKLELLFLLGAIE